MKGSTFSVRMKVDFHEEIKEPIYAFTIKNLQGIEITGTNTMYEKADVKDKKEGESQEITFTQKLDLQGGEISDFSWMYRLPQRRVCGISQIV